MRLEPQCRNADMNTGLQARIYDPLWLLARQWQIGEFQGEDNGSPAAARWHGECARFTRYFPGAFADQTSVEGQIFDSNSVPLETLVEGERFRPELGKLEKLRFAAEAGLHFLRMLDQQPTSRSYRELFKSKFLFTPLTNAERSRLEAESLSFIDLVTPRVPDGRKLYATMSVALRPAPPDKPALPSDLTVAPADVAEIQKAAVAWLGTDRAGILQWTPRLARFQCEQRCFIACRQRCGER